MRSALVFAVLAASLPFHWGAVLAQTAGASDATPGTVTRAAPTPVALRASFISEARFGVFAQDPWSPEAGTASLHGEILFAKPFSPADLFASYFVPRPHIGGSLNLAGRTSFAFAGLTWNVDVTPRLFLEASLGGAIHDGHEDGNPILANQAALGCSPGLRETASLGYRFSERLSFVATVEHVGNGLCGENRGLTNIGARIGYAF